MKVAIATADWATVAGHAGKTRTWLVYDLQPTAGFVALPEPTRLTLDAAQVLHHFKDEGPHPLDGVVMVIAGSAGDGFVRHMKTRGTDVLLTGESDPKTALDMMISGQPLPEQRFDITTSLCRLRDLFSRH
jgi:putative NIF3 family GTP cyclohydrolase 1 type 2